MNQQQWLDWRRKGVGSSDSPIIMGVSPWSTRYQLWEQKISGKETECNYAMQRGTNLEEPARQCFENMMDVEVFPKNVEHKKFPWMRASFDGIDLDGKVLVEIKCPLKKENHELAKQGKVPEVYYPQLQHQLEVSGLDGMYYFSFDGSEGVIVEVERDQKYIDKMIKEEEGFWACVSNKTPPPLSSRDCIDLENDKEWRSLAVQWKSISEKKRDLAEQLKDIVNQEELLKESFIKQARGLSAYGCGIKLTKYFQKGQVDYSKIPVLQGVDLDAYRMSPTERWRLS